MRKSACRYNTLREIGHCGFMIDLKYSRFQMVRQAVFRANHQLRIVRNEECFPGDFNKTNTTGTPVFWHWVRGCHARVMAHGRPVGSRSFNITLFDLLFAMLSNHGF